MPTREEMIAALQGDQASQAPTREEMIAALNAPEQTGVTTAPGAFGKIIQPNKKPVSKDLETLKNAIANNAPLVGATIGEFMAPPLGAYPGAMIGSAIKQYNNPPENMTEGAKNLAKDIGYNAVVPQALGAGIKYALNASGIGPAIYKSAFKVPDYIAQEEGARPLSSYFMKEKPILSTKSMALENAKLGKQSMEGMRSAIDEASQSMPTVDAEAALDRALNKADEIANNSFTAGQGKKLQQQVQNYIPPGYGSSIPLEEARRLSIEAGKNANWAGKAADMPKNAVLQEARRGLENEVLNTLEQTNPDLANKYITAKQGAQTSIVTEPYLKQQVGKAVRKNNLTEVKGAMAGRALENIGPNSAPAHGVLPLAMMYAAKMYNTPAGRTAIGKTLSSLGEASNPAIETGIRVFNPWKSMYGKQGENK